MATVSLRDTGIAFDEAQIVEALKFEVRPDAVILCGSRATGDAVATSDYDVLVVLPSLRVPREVAKLSRIGDELSRTLGAPVSVNPLPRFRLRRPGRSFLVWKALHEGRELSSRGALIARRDGMPTDREAASTSYAVSGIRYLLSDLEPQQLGADRLPPDVSRGVRKALLHAAQLHLLGSGRYAARMCDCLPLLDDGIGIRLSSLAARTEQPETWFAARGLLLGTVHLLRPTLHRAVLENAQYAALSWMAGDRRRWRAILSRQSIPFRLANAAIALALAVEPAGALDQVQMRAASEWLAPIRRREATIADSSWGDLRAFVEAEWPRAHPLLGL
jgi:predicted nucleotidyltransferase